MTVSWKMKEKSLIKIVGYDKRVYPFRILVMFAGEHRQEHAALWQKNTS
jgi:hypothetical protein